MKTFIIFFLLRFTLLPVFSQDTLFVNKHHFNSPVQNTFAAKETIFAKTTTELFKLDNKEWVPIDEDFSKPYVFYKENFYESDFIPKSELFEISSMKQLIPQKGKFIATAARAGSRFFVASGSELFEYEIRDHYTRSYFNMSIRDIYIEDRLKVISTYSGIYVNDSILLNNPNYSNGPLVKIDSSYFLVWDEISKFYPPDSSRVIPNGTSLFAGKARKLIPWNDHTIALHTQLVSKVLPEFELQPIHQGLEYLDLEVYQDDLIFSTFQGLCLRWDGTKVDTLAKIPSRIRDLFAIGNRLLLASDLGVYELNNGEQNSLKKIANTLNSVMTTFDDFGNLWIATENGLYILTPNYPDPIVIIPNVEFNREALLLSGELLYVGAVDGLYTLNTYEIEKSYLPNLLSSVKIPLQERKSIWVIAGFIALSLLLTWYYFSSRIPKESIFSSRLSNKNELDLNDLETQILEQRIFTVENLAEYLETNPVQLNRNFKKMGTTPGKFLKKVKLKQAQEFHKSGLSLEEIASKIGYSVKFLKNELNID
ncbi:MAG: helix-turn-helix domain-containing protein [Algoriphagus sp.]|uniref:helix-turn-helix domain-containing protein n=1 Tax=Algoriphagus sp. TaxID=1872435 RepID=UPI0026388B13|nr:helix-turn-helix domain-containing protein [Algoriphagus sp.]MDG1275862.1 helix-turn-helix domain-containing protein [Algoriphagus sp.]